MHLPMPIFQLLIILAIAALVWGAKRQLKGLDGDSLRSQLMRELGRMPVYSAETVESKEAEFIRDHLPRKFPTVIALVIVVIFGAVGWWLTR